MYSHTAGAGTWPGGQQVKSDHGDQSQVSRVPVVTVQCPHHMQYHLHPLDTIKNGFEKRNFSHKTTSNVECCYYWTTLNFGIPQVLVFQIQLQSGRPVTCN